jgi:hypothetical protein
VEANLVFARFLTDRRRVNTWFTRTQEIHASSLLRSPDPSCSAFFFLPGRDKTHGIHEFQVLDTNGKPVEAMPLK